MQHHRNLHLHMANDAMRPSVMPEGPLVILAFWKDLKTAQLGPVVR